MQYQPTAQQTTDERRISNAMEARANFDTLDALLSTQERRLKAEWRALQQARTAARNARHASARAANAPYISGSLPPAA